MANLALLLLALALGVWPALDATPAIDGRTVVAVAIIVVVVARAARRRTA